MNWLQNLFKSASDAEAQAIRSVALVCANLEVLGMNLNQVGRHTYTGDDAIAAAKKYERYIKGELK